MMIVNQVNNENITRMDARKGSEGMNF